MRLQANGFEAWININSREVEHFQPETVDNPSGQTCWIASEINQGFSIHWKNTDVFCQTAARIWVDGLECAGEIVSGPNREAFITGRRTSGSTISPFKFSALNMTDDDDFLYSTGNNDVGTIRIEIWTVTVTGTQPYNKAAPAPEMKVHERSKKGGSHQIKLVFADEVQEAPRSAAIIQYLEAFPLVTFTFKYRSMDLLRADGVAPGKIFTKRKASSSPQPSTSGTKANTELEAGEERSNSFNLKARRNYRPDKKRLPCGHGDYRPDLTSLLPYSAPCPTYAPYLSQPLPLQSRISEMFPEKHVLFTLSIRPQHHHMDVIANANREKYNLINSQYSQNLEAVRELQGTLLDDILPSVTDELELDEEAIQWAEEWLADTCSLFRILRRNKFTRSFAMESIRKTLVWRLTNLWPPDPHLHLPFVQCLPSAATDPFGRPILVIKVVSFDDSSDAFKPLIIRGLECLRLHLQRLNDESRQIGTGAAPTLQYNIDLVTWTLRDAIPKFPGLLAAAFMINYSWTHAGIWSIAKRVLPAPAISRVFFPTQQELVDYFSALWRNSGFSNRVARSLVG
ncbi:hypothetical protein R3P38DRAFT_3326409 [Favolaschia claudopus]|uniref:DUF7918 domain-containing protein n=1 Tax=Favolaschia claudopus TaxID=2862362 RepID=A0AAW0AAW1_9AGAR